MYGPPKCCQKSFKDYYVGQTGSGLSYYRGSDFQTGYGLGGLFRSFFHPEVPLLKSGVKVVGRQVWQSKLNMVGDVSHGDTVKVAAKQPIKEMGCNLTYTVAIQMKTMIASGKNNKKRKLNKKRVICKRAKKRKSQDIFS